MSKRIIAKATGIYGQVNVYRDTEWDEYSVVPMWITDKERRERVTSYHGNDRDDAIATAGVVAASLDQPARVEVL